ncbi:MAG TPA: hypothetical protein VGB44_09460 [Flavobacterium sp.]|jgi:hypothetical protein
MTKSEYIEIIVESFELANNTSGRHGLVHIRPIAGQDPFLENMFVECSKALSTEFPIETRFKIKAKVVRREGRTSFIYSHYKWEYSVVP